MNPDSVLSGVSQLVSVILPPGLTALGSGLLKCITERLENRSLKDVLTQ